MDKFRAQYALHRKCQQKSNISSPSSVTTSSSSNTSPPTRGNAQHLSSTTNHISTKKNLEGDSPIKSVRNNRSSIYESDHSYPNRGHNRVVQEKISSPLSSSLTASTASSSLDSYDNGSCTINQQHHVLNKSSIKERELYRHTSQCFNEPTNDSNDGQKDCVASTFSQMNARKKPQHEMRANINHNAKLLNSLRNSGDQLQSEPPLRNSSIDGSRKFQSKNTSKPDVQSNIIKPIHKEISDKEKYKDSDTRTATFNHAVKNLVSKPESKSNILLESDGIDQIENKNECLDQITPLHMFSSNRTDVKSVSQGSTISSNRVQRKNTDTIRSSRPISSHLPQPTSVPTGNKLKQHRLLHAATQMVPTEAQLRWAQFHHKERNRNSQIRIEKLMKYPLDESKVLGAQTGDGDSYTSYEKCSCSGSDDSTCEVGTKDFRIKKREKTNKFKRKKKRKNRKIPSLSRGRRAVLRVSSRKIQVRRQQIKENGFLMVPDDEEEEGEILSQSKTGGIESDEDTSDLFRMLGNDADFSLYSGATGMSRSTAVTTTGIHSSVGIIGSVVQGSKKKHSMKKKKKKSRSAKLLKGRKSIIATEEDDEERMKRFEEAYLTMCSVAKAPNTEDELRDGAHFSDPKRVWKRASHIPIAVSIDGRQYDDLQRAPAFRHKSSSMNYGLQNIFEAAQLTDRGATWLSHLPKHDRSNMMCRKEEFGGSFLPDAVAGCNDNEININPGQKKFFDLMNLLQISSESRLVCENEFVPQQKNFQLSSAKRNGESHIENSNVESVGRIDEVDTAIAIYPNSIDYVSSENKTDGLIRQNNKESRNSNENRLTYEKSRVTNNADLSDKTRTIDAAREEDNVKFRSTFIKDKYNIGRPTQSFNDTFGDNRLNNGTSLPMEYISQNNNNTLIHNKFEGDLLQKEKICQQDDTQSKISSAVDSNYFANCLSIHDSNYTEEITMNGKITEMIQRSFHRSPQTEYNTSIIDTDNASEISVELDSEYLRKKASNFMFSPTILSKRHRQAIYAIESHNWQQVEYLLSANPWLAEMKDLTDQFLLHKLALYGVGNAIDDDECFVEASPHHLNEDMIKAFPASVHKLDKDGNLPLHMAAQAGNFDMVLRMLDLFPSGASVQNNDGFLPLHLATLSGAICLPDREEIIPRVVNIILDKFPTALSVTDNDGNLPLHLAASFLKRNVGLSVISLLINEVNKQGSKLCLRTAKKSCQNPIDVESTNSDNQGSEGFDKSNGSLLFFATNKFSWTPLMCAIRHKPGWQVVEALLRIHGGPNAALEKDEKNRNLLQIVLGDKRLHDAATILSILKYVPELATLQDKNGILPIEMACLQGLQSEVIMGLALIDLPLDLSQKNGIDTCTKIGKSWFYLTCDCDDTHYEIVKEILSLCSYVQKRELCFKKYRNGASVISRATPKCNQELRNSLRFIGRYEFHSSAVISSPYLKIFEAVDFGNTDHPTDDGEQVYLHCYEDEEHYRNEVSFFIH